MSALIALFIWAGCALSIGMAVGKALKKLSGPAPEELDREIAEAIAAGLNVIPIDARPASRATRGSA